MAFFLHWGEQPYIQSIAQKMGDIKLLLFSPVAVLTSGFFVNTDSIWYYCGLSRKCFVSVIACILTNKLIANPLKGLARTQSLLFLCD